MLEAGADLRTIQVLLGHKKIEHTTIYFHLSKRHLTAVANPLDRMEVDALGDVVSRSKATEEGMGRPTLEVGDIIRQAGNSYVERNRSHLAWAHLKGLRAIQNCRRAALGSHLDRCSRCSHRAISYNWCRNRHCPKCQTHARDQWLAARSEELLPVEYLHVVFTLPHALSALILTSHSAERITRMAPASNSLMRLLAGIAVSTARNTNTGTANLRCAASHTADVRLLALSYTGSSVLTLAYIRFAQRQPPGNRLFSAFHPAVQYAPKYQNQLLYP